jgi:hypothetical protein
LAGTNPERPQSRRDRLPSSTRRPGPMPDPFAALRGGPGRDSRVAPRDATCAAPPSPQTGAHDDGRVPVTFSTPPWVRALCGTISDAPMVAWVEFNRGLRPSARTFYSTLFSPREPSLFVSGAVPGAVKRLLAAGEGRWRAVPARRGQPRVACETYLVVCGCRRRTATLDNAARCNGHDGEPESHVATRRCPAGRSSCTLRSIPDSRTASGSARVSVRAPTVMASGVPESATEQTSGTRRWRVGHPPPRSPTPRWAVG